MGMDASGVGFTIAGVIITVSMILFLTDSHALQLGLAWRNPLKHVRGDKAFQGMIEEGDSDVVNQSEPNQTWPKMSGLSHPAKWRNARLGWSPLWRIIVNHFLLCSFSLSRRQQSWVLHSVYKSGLYRHVERVSSPFLLESSVGSLILFSFPFSA